VQAATTVEGQQLLAGIIDILSVLKQRSHVRENPATVFLLRHLRASDPLRVSDLAECSRLDISTVSRHVKALEESGHLMRIEDPEDKRACLLRITEQGCDLYDAAMAARGAVLDRAIADWSGDDRRDLAVLVGRLARDLHEPHETRSGS